MTAPTPEGNSCSLEDCYTNIFALTDIGGIKWRKLAIDPVQTNIDPFEDPVLKSYSRCLQEDILCVWRRVAKHSESRPADISFGKELWIFWYGDQPIGLDELLSPYLKEIEYGAWENDTLSYECRTLLFKALHNLIERCLLAKNFIRLGKWFVQPQEPNNSDQSHLSFCFNFFLHGESTVCASIEVKQHPAVSFLSPTHLQHVQENHSQLQVILAPYGLSGTLTGVTYRDSDRDTAKCLEDWAKFYPIKTEEAKENDYNHLPNLVEVIVAGGRMKYPSCYTLLVDYDDPTQHRPTHLTDPMSSIPHSTCIPPRPHQSHHQNLVHNAPLTPPTSPEDALHAAGIMGDMGVKLLHPQSFTERPPEAVSDVTALASGIFCTQLAERVNQDCTITAGLSKRPSDMTDEATSGGWDFAEPGSRGSCNCLRLRAQKSKTSSGVPGKGGLNKKGQQALERQQSRLTRTTPFHRRNQVAEDYLHFDADIFMPRMSSANPGCVSSGGGVQGNQQTAQVHSSEAVNNMVSPASNGIPSPLDEPHNQPVDSAANIDATMPTLSPHPPLKPGEKDTSKQLASESHVNSTMVNGIAGDNGSIFPKSLMAPKQENVTSPYSWNKQNLENTKANINSWLRSQQKHVEHRGLKRPTLPTMNGESEELITDSLYNFDTVHSWSDYPLKKVRYEKIEHLNGIQDGRSNSNSGQNHKPLKPPTPQPSAPDPYEFSDESSITPAAISRSSMRNNSRDDAFRRPSFGGKGEDEKDPSRQGGGDGFLFHEDRNNIDLGSLTSPPSTPGTQTVGGSLTREVDLIPQPSDLDNLFESDSDNDDPFVQQSPAPSKSTDDTKATRLPNPSTEANSIAPAELSRMYPTPPSLDNNSPMASSDAHMETSSSVMEAVSINIKTESIIGTLTEDLYKVTMCVYKPDTQAKFLSSDKYEPVTLFNVQVSAIPGALPEYKPSWPFAMPLMDKHHIGASHYINLPSIENMPSNPSIRMPSSAIEASPATFQNSVGQSRTPMSYELQSPASNASSYLNKTPGSNINHNLGTNNQMPEVNSLVMNIVLSDSVLNLFKDHNFDSCSICVCNMNIKGADAGVYIPDDSGEQQYKCTCGFSAVLNRRFGHNAGLFYEDEVNITGIRDERLDTRKPSLLAINCDKDGQENVTNVQDVTQVVLQLLLGQFSVPYPSCTSQSLHHKLMVRSRTYCNNSVNIVQLQDGNDVAYFALDQGRQAMEHCHPNKLDDHVMKSSCLHKWTHLQGMSQIPQSSLESVNVLKSLQPLLQEAIQNKRMTRLWEHTYKLQGPLTWIEFHQLAGRGTVENSEPQPIPSLLIGLDKDSANVSPYALKFWEKNMLEPYGHPRDVAYVIVTPENDFLVGQIRSFFKELSTVYEFSRLGRHCHIEKLRDGILRVGKKTAQDLGEQEIDDWFKYIGDSPLAVKLRLYAQACRHHLAPFLAQQTDLKSMFTPTTSTHRNTHHRPMDPGVGMDNMSNSHDDKDGGDPPHRDQYDDVEDNYECPALVIYVVNPFTYAQDWDDLHRLAMIGLLRCYQEIVPKLPESLQNNVYLQIVPLQTIIDFKESTAQLQLLKNIAFSVFTSCRWNLAHNILGRSLTGFGPAAAAVIVNKDKETTGEGEGGPLSQQQRLYSPAFILAPVKDKQEQLAESCKDKHEKNTILMCVYCLSEDQRWLLACCTDDRGETVETCAINIEIPDRNRRKKTSARKIGLGKLWDFLLGVVSMTASPARIVIGRFGRIGHGELKGWSGLLSKKNIQRCSRKMREVCNQCSYQGNSEYPCILSACLTSLEQQPTFNISPECVKVGDKQHSSCPLQTPRDASCSHILVFPTSATAQANTHQDSTGGLDLGTSHLEFGVDLSDIQDDFENNEAGFDGLMDVFVAMTENSPIGSPRHASNPCSPGLMDLGRNSPRMNGMSMTNQHTSQFIDPQDDPPNLLQQPLAMGYYISTAETGPLPRWFWSACPDNELSSVKMFKVALHIHCSVLQDDLMHQQPGNATHPLDSSLTCDVLRFVLEKYNALSWLTFDPAKNDRQSCLPLHMNVLMQMYHAMNAFI